MQKNNYIKQAVYKSWSECFSDHFDFEVALSGGLDSIVLLHILASIRNEHPIQLSAVHVHHGLQTEADKWVLFCQNICDQWNIPLRIAYANIDPNSPLGPEASAREARYNFFRQSKQSVIAVAHHQDDQIETFLLSMLRGGGLRGMASMVAKRHLDVGHLLWRPLLNLSRSELENYAQDYQLEFVEDPSNSDTHYLRNWVRHDLLPFMTQKNPHISAHLIRNIHNLQNTKCLIDEIITELWQQVSCGNKINCSQWRELSSVKRVEVLKYFCEYNGLGHPRTQSLTAFNQQLFNHTNSTHKWSLPNGESYVYHGALWPWSRQEPLRVKYEASWKNEDINWIRSSYGVPASFIQGIWHIRSANKQDTITTNIGSKNIFKILQENQVPPFLRHIWPILVDKNNICQIVLNIRINSSVEVKKDAFLPEIKELDYYLGTNFNC